MKSFLIALVALCSAHYCLSQGSLTPPGVPAPTMKTLAQVEARIAITNTGLVTTLLRPRGAAFSGINGYIVNSSYGSPGVTATYKYNVP